LPDAADPGRSGIKYAAEYRGAYYALSGLSELTAFLIRPAEVLAAAAFPEDLPRAVGPRSAGVSTPELSGYCAVSLGRGPSGGDYTSRVAALRQGDTAHAVEYKKRIFLLADSATRAEFLSRPWRYDSLLLPAKLPPPVLAIVLAALPTPGYIEQTMGQLLADALCALAELRPKYPTLSRKETAVKFVALYLRAHNPKRRLPHHRAKLAASLQEFSDCCVAAATLGGERPPVGTAAEEEFLRLGAAWDSVGTRSLGSFLS
jgi:adenylate/nucleoside-diphosphate kinase